MCKRSLAIIVFFIKKLLFVFWPSLILFFWYGAISLLCTYETSAGDSGLGLYTTNFIWIGGIISLIIYEFIQPVVILLFTYKYIKNTRTFLITYYLFLVSYFLFIIKYIMFKGEIHSIALSGVSLNALLFYLCSFSFIFFFITELYKSKTKMIRYLFGFLSAISDVVICYYLYNIGFLHLLFDRYDERFYEDKTYLIPLVFAMIQLFIEIYYFIKREKEGRLLYM
ncbi:hypothetical protein [Sulfurospirillum arsenophilum]|uniref:hypothetical protein n=1 Tax=Sulfurospirillum arsenophilum TaxID=56698 RepID=UPI0005A6A31B|nr:hypothetical protein [Sulfurospirillum arsenophilum]